jgi:acetyl esterase/lipase
MGVLGQLPANTRTEHDCDVPLDGESEMVEHRLHGSDRQRRIAMTVRARPPFDVELAPALEGLPGFFTTLRPSSIAEFRAATTRPSSLDDVIAGRPVEVTDHAVTGYGGGEIVVTVLRRSDHEGAANPGVYLIHGGGMVGGSRWAVAPMLVEWVLQYGAVAAAVDFRLAPEFSDPVPVEDCYAGLEWFAGSAEAFGFDPRRVLIGGQSAGGGLSAGTTLLARDRGGPMPAAMLLMWPMLDDRNETVSAQQIDGVGIWDRTSNETGWTALLGDRRGSADVSTYAAPARATDLSGLPPAYIEAGSAEVFRDEAVAFAGRMWQAGGSAELHIWAGGFHGFQTIVPTAAMSQTALLTRESWVRRMMAP